MQMLNLLCKKCKCRFCTRLYYVYEFEYVYVYDYSSIKSMRPAHERVNAPLFWEIKINRHFPEKTLIFALDFSAGWDYI